MPQKRVVAIHDISCFGRCSLTVALPIISASGIETAVIPTAVLSTHTGGFTGNTFRDLTDDISAIAEHWNKEGITTDAVYSGYLCSKQQIFSVLNAIRLISNRDTEIIVDPVMADNGKLYKGFEESFPIYMLELCKSADIITPNITEACLMVDVPYKEGPYEERYISELLNRLYDLTGCKIVLTGVCCEESKIGVAVFDAGNIYYVFSERHSKSYHGTGDIFASTLTSAIMNGKDLKQAAKIAVDFTADCIKYTSQFDTDMRYGVKFESQIPKLIKYLGQ